MRSAIGGAVAAAQISCGHAVIRILMKYVLTLLVLPGIVVAAGPAHGDPDGGSSADPDAAFLAALNAAGITYSDPGKSITAGQTMCDFADQGKSGKALVATLQKHNEELTSERARLFIAIALHEYCPQHLANTMQGLAVHG
ncbi:DUF732 domain-containing protein [[Mycobacterium] vasticus]|uniref:DUF732 domain-containing protein n=1 Tax=[Mycobacterium] vasticus TaxID=2875777 RepID=A0ABU5YZ66_9MYCO|nr:DUF732 domain-containing protein [Mycolicibacter sp. MYC017]MEB3070431.1 DUF732 domain-containing protein [Mycolicibacter sp. MYC017]